MIKYHVCIRIRGVLEWKLSELSGLLKHPDGRLMTCTEVEAHMLALLEQGTECIPLAACDNFDAGGVGCRGHSV